MNETVARYREACRYQLQRKGFGGPVHEVNGQMVLWDGVGQHHVYICPTHSVDGPYECLLVGPKGSTTSFSDGPATDMEPTEDLIDSLLRAEPYPLERAWGVLDGSDIVELAIFRYWSELPPRPAYQVIPKVYSVIAKDRQVGGTWQRWSVGRCNMRNFWRLVQSRSLVPVSDLLGGAKFGFHSATDRPAFVVGGILLLQPEVWRADAGVTMNHISRLKPLKLPA